MSRSLRTMMALLCGGIVAAVVNAQVPTPPTTAEQSPCSPCHTCAKPTAENPCLRECLRPNAPGHSGEPAPDFAPDVVILDELEDLYLPVPFDHRGHADMAEMTIGCTICHHYTPEGSAHPACKSCHEVGTMREDMRKPGLKGAYHRQCMNCHREWSHQTACEVCHPPKAGRSDDGQLTTRPSKDDIVGRMHPPIPEPETKVYQTSHLRQPGTNVTFRHKEHIHRFGLKCAECHHEDSCSRCHEEGKSEAGRAKTLEEHHKPCATCHDMENPERCDHCHWAVGQPEPAPFDHVNTGWPLKPYHENRSCRVCHRDVRFVKLDNSCGACHGEWDPEKFEHMVTGQALDENHAGQDCEVCHIGAQYDRPPRCDECHDDDEGISFPEKRPGPRVELRKATADPPRSMRVKRGKVESSSEGKD